MKRMLMVLTVAALAVSVSKAQHLGATQIQINNGTSVGTLSAPGVAGTYTWTLPAQSGTLSLSSFGGWLIGGNGLLPTDPGLLGSTDSADVSLIAAGTTRMTLLDNAAAVLLPGETQLRLGDASGGEYVALVSPSANKTSGYTFVLPDSLPGGEDVRLKVETINGNVVTLGYTNPLTTGQIGFKGLDTSTCNTSNSTYVPIVGLTFEVFSNSIYSFEAIVAMDALTDGGVITWGTPTSETEDAAITILYRLFDLSGNGNLPGGLDEDTEQGVTAGDTYILKGYIQTGNLTGTEPHIVQLRIKRGSSGTETCITAKSAVQLITE